MPAIKNFFMRIVSQACTGGHVAGKSAAYENQAFVFQILRNARILPVQLFFNVVFIFPDKVGVKQQALEQVANEFEVLEKDKGEIQQWISDVKKELSTTADQEDQNPEVVVRRRKLKVSSLPKDEEITNKVPTSTNWLPID